MLTMENEMDNFENLEICDVECARTESKYTVGAEFKTVVGGETVETFTLERIERVMRPDAMANVPEFHAHYSNGDVVVIHRDSATNVLWRPKNKIADRVPQ